MTLISGSFVELSLLVKNTNKGGGLNGRL